MKDRVSSPENRPSTRRPKGTGAAVTDPKFREDANFMDLDDWTEEDDDFFDDFFPEEVKRR